MGSSEVAILAQRIGERLSRLHRHGAPLPVDV
jgi:hypothetical protein